MYTTAWCGYCERAKALLNRRGIAYEEIRVDHEPDFRRRLLERTGGWTVPQILIDDEPISGYSQLHALERAGGLERIAA